MQTITLASTAPLAPAHRTVIERCPAPAPKWLGGRNGITTGRRLAATVWVYHGEAVTPIDEAWAISHTPQQFRREDCFNPVEILIPPSEVAAAIAKWEAISDRPGCCRVTYQLLMASDRYNRVSDAPATAEEAAQLRDDHRRLRVELAARIAARKAAA